MRFKTDPVKWKAWLEKELGKVEALLCQQSVSRLQPEPTLAAAAEAPSITRSPSPSASASSVAEAEAALVHGPHSPEERARLAVRLLLTFCLLYGQLTSVLSCSSPHWRCSALAENTTEGPCAPTSEAGRFTLPG